MICPGYQDARKISESLAEKGTTLVFGGGNLGLMGECAKIFKNKNSKIISVIPKKLAVNDRIFMDYTEIIKTDTMNERKKILEEISQVFIALAGGFGTLEEILEIITLKQLGYHHKPIIILL